MKITISKLLSLQKIVRERLNELKSLRSEVSTKERLFFGGDERKEKEANYNVIEVDKKIVDLERFLLDLDFTIKESNAKTKVDFNTNIDELLSPIK